MSPDASHLAIKQTTEYIDAIKRRLAIVVERGRAVSLVESVTPQVLRQLRADLDDILKQDEGARDAVAKGDGAFLQAVAFGESTDLNVLVRTGYTLGDRVVLWDYLHRVLTNQSRAESPFDIAAVQAIANGIVELEPLAASGHLVVIRHPLDWSKEASRAIRTIAAAGGLTPDIMIVASTLAAATALGLHPYTVGNKSFYTSVTQPAIAKAIASTPDHRALIRGLLAERVLTDRRFSFLLDLPLSSFRDTIAESADFYRQFSDRLSATTQQDGEYRLATLTAELDKLINSRNAAVQRAGEAWALHGATLAATIGMVVAWSSPEPLLRLAGALTSMSVALAKMIQTPSEKGGTVATVFRRLKRTTAEYTDAFEAAVLANNDPADSAQIILNGFPKRLAAGIVATLDEHVVDVILKTHGDYVFLYLDELREVSVNAFWKHIEFGLSQTSDIVRLVSYLQTVVKNGDALPRHVLHSFLHRVLISDDDELETPQESGPLLSSLVNASQHARTTRTLLRQWFGKLRSTEREVANIRLRALLGADSANILDGRPKTRAKRAGGSV
jgi:hypothetical protein